MSEIKQNEWKEREVGALWKKVGNANKANYCTGYIVSDELGNKIRQRVIMFANKNKSNEKSPDFIIYTANDITSEASPAPHANVPKSAMETEAQTKLTSNKQPKNAFEEDDVPSM